MFEVLFLGTGASVPSRDRSLPCVALRQGRSVSLFDCGEGSQRQLMISPFSFMKVDRIFITHMHGDHILGLPGLLQTMGMSGRRKPVDIFGPVGIASALEDLLNACEGELEFETPFHELTEEETFQFDGFSVTAFPTVHNTPSVGYLYREDDPAPSIDKERAEKLGLSPGSDFARIKNGETVNGIGPSDVLSAPVRGCSMVYTGDTVPCGAVREHSMGTDLLIHESTYVDDDSELAKEHFHSTAAQAARTAKECDVRMLALIHISNRYGDSGRPLEEARGIFAETIAPADLQRLTVSRSGIRVEEII